METTATATAMEVRFPARRTLTSWVSPVRQKVSRSRPRVKAVAGLSSSPDTMSSLRKPFFSPVGRADTRDDRGAGRRHWRGKRCCDHYF